MLELKHNKKEKDYVYGVGVYEILGIWKGYYRVNKSLVLWMKPWTEAGDNNNKYMKYHFKLTYRLSVWNVRRKVDYHAGGKWFIHGPKRHKENQLPSLKHPCWVSLVWHVNEDNVIIQHISYRTSRTFGCLVIEVCYMMVSMTKCKKDVTMDVSNGVKSFLH